MNHKNKLLAKIRSYFNRNKISIETQRDELWSILMEKLHQLYSSEGNGNPNSDEGLQWWIAEFELIRNRGVMPPDKVGSDWKMLWDRLNELDMLRPRQLFETLTEDQKGEISMHIAALQFR